MENEERKIKPSLLWLKRKYDEFNQAYFNGELMACEFSIFTSGKGSEGGILGKFSMTNCNYFKSDRRRKIVHIGEVPGEVSFYRNGRFVVDITKNNFVKICKPRISLNGNYSWNEFSMSETLIHEMCHYLVYIRNNFCMPSRSHGSLFMSVASEVTSRTNGVFSVEGVATAETMKNVELDQKFVEKRKRRAENAANTATIALIKRADLGTYMMFIANENITMRFVNLFKGPNEKYPFVKIIRDPDIAAFLLRNGYKKFRVPTRHYNMAKYPKDLDMLMKADGEVQKINESRDVSSFVEMIVENEINRFKNEVGIDADDEDDLVYLDRSVNLGIEGASTL